MTSVERDGNLMGNRERFTPMDLSTGKPRLERLAIEKLHSNESRGWVSRQICRSNRMNLRKRCALDLADSNDFMQPLVFRYARNGSAVRAVRNLEHLEGNGSPFLGIHRFGSLPDFAASAHTEEFFEAILAVDQHLGRKAHARHRFHNST